ncbi:MAG: maleylpyruvate isomerase N-terminal domain-containing protein, partial [Actinomycetota bacterium]
MSGLLRREVVEVYESGVAAVVDSAGPWDAAEWGRLACGGWDRADTVRHLCAVIAWYHSWLDRALAGESSPPFQPHEFDGRNQAGVDERRGLTGPEAVIEFERDAVSYLDRAQRHWSAAFGFPL